MSVQGPSGTTGIPESPILRSALSGHAVTARKSEESAAGMGDMDRAEVSARLATALRRNNALVQDSQSGVNATRIELEALERIESAVERLLSADGDDAGPEAIRQTVETIRESADRARYGGRRLLAELTPEELSIEGERAEGSVPGRERLLAAMARIDAVRNRIAGELANHTRTLAAAEVERENLFAASGTGSLDSSAEAQAAVREASTRLGPWTLEASAANLDRGRVMQILE